MDTSKEEIVNLRKQINRLKISLMFTQVLMIALLLILGYQCLWSIWNYHYLLQQISIRFTYYQDENGGIWFDSEPVEGKPEWMQRADEARRRRNRRYS